MQRGACTQFGLGDVTVRATTLKFAKVSNYMRYLHDDRFAYTISLYVVCQGSMAIIAE